MENFEKSLSVNGLAKYVASQINNLFPDRCVQPVEIFKYLGETLERLEYCFSRVSNKYYFDGNKVIFNHLHTDQYAAFIYFLSNTIFYKDGNRDLAERVYAINKYTLSLEIFYEVKLPEIFYFQHPVATVLGRCQYSDYLVVWQRSSTGADIDLNYPKMGRGVVLYGNSSVIGRCSVGDNCWLSYGATVAGTDVPSNSIVFGQPRSNVFKRSSRSVIEQYFRNSHE